MRRREGGREKEGEEGRESEKGGLEGRREGEWKGEERAE